MAKPTAAKKLVDQPAAHDPLEMATATAAAKTAAPYVHEIKPGVVCKTDTKGLAAPSNRSLAEIAVDASRGFIPLWGRDVTLRWRFQEQSMAAFQNPKSAKQSLKTLLGEAILLWGDACPVRFTQRDDAWDFEIVMQSSDDCTTTGCVLASAFFPDGGRHELVVYPKMFDQSRKEQVETLAHEIGHVFGLRHFFAKLSEDAWPSEIFGTHQRFSIMNYGGDSTMSEHDRSDLKQLYSLVWSGRLQQINGTPVKLVAPFSTASGNPFLLAAKREVCPCCGGQRP